METEIEENVKISQPHLNANEYKSFDHSTSPRHCDFIRLHADGTVLVGCSNLTERHWTGAAIITDGVEDLKTVLLENKETSNSINLVSGVTTGCFLEDSTKILLGEDSGCISVWSKSKNGEWATMWSKNLETEEHDGAVLAVDCLGDVQTYVTVGDDANIKIWDIADFICTRTFRYNQSAINDVAVCLDSRDMFATAAMDGTVSLWSQHCENRVKVLHSSDCEIRCVCWLDEKLAAVGEEGGRLALLDLRHEKEPVASVTMPHPLHRLCVESSTKRIAVCGDSPIVSVFNCDGDSRPRRVCTERSHTDLVRGLAWDKRQPGQLYSAAWDCTVRKHSIPSL